jgi:hypothetical protein
MIVLFLINSMLPIQVNCHVILFKGIYPMLSICSPLSCSFQPSLHHLCSTITLFTPPTFICFVLIDGRYIKSLLRLGLADISGRLPCILVVGLHHWIMLNESTSVQIQLIYSHSLDFTRYLGFHIHHLWIPSCLSIIYINDW